MITYSGSPFKWQLKVKINEYYTHKWIIWKRVENKIKNIPDYSCLNDKRRKENWKKITK